MAVTLIHFNHIIETGLVKWPSMRTSGRITNYGDVLVCGAILNQVKIDVGETIEFGQLANSDRFIIRGSTYLHNEFDFCSAIKTIESTESTGAIVGLGAQSPQTDPTFLDNSSGARNFIALLNERTNSISVRGEFSAEVVRRLGGKNIRITGCPSIFYMQSAPNVSIPATFNTNYRAVGISTHSCLAGIFCRDPAAARRAHGLVIGSVLESCRVVRLFEQGILPEFTASDRNALYEKRLIEAKKLASSWGLSVGPDELISLYSSVESVEDWCGKVRDLDAVLGFRFHGNMVALMQGRPCYYIVYDSRIEELCRLYNLPWQDVSASNYEPIEMIERHDWASTNAAVRKCAAEMSAFWEENGFSPLIAQRRPLALEV